MKADWISCDGRGNVGKKSSLHLTARAEGCASSPSEPCDTSSPPHSLALSRRQVIISAALASLGWRAGSATALDDVVVNPDRRGPRGDVLVVLFLRGGMDGLNAVIPYAEEDYHRLRPGIGLAPPNDRRAGKADSALDLNGFFGLHPALAPLKPLYDEGLLAFVHACGSGDQTRSHFEAMSAMERGLPNEETGAVSGWLARHLDSTQGGHNSPLRAVAFTGVMPDTLRGATDATALDSLADFRLSLPGREEEMRRALAELYKDGKDAVAQAGRETLAVLDTLNRMDPDRYRQANGAVYPPGGLGNGLRQVACLIRGNVGLEAAFLDRGGWDTHVAQGVGTGWLASQLDDLGKSLAAFAKDLGPEMGRVTMVVMTEFGRRAYENSGLGTDHGRGSVMLLLGGGVVGGQVHAKWPGLKEDRLEPPGDLRVTTDYRDVLAEIVSKRLRNDRLAEVFPNYAPKFPGVVKG
jgi:uncharacterized protein (DUF1501 family)